MISCRMTVRRTMRKSIEDLLHAVDDKAGA